MSIKDKFRVCDSCKGKGKVWIYSHGCWGEPDNYQRTCSTCGGLGFIINRNYKVKIVKALGIL